MSGLRPILKPSAAADLRSERGASEQFCATSGVAPHEGSRLGEPAHRNNFVDPQSGIVL